MSSPENKPPVSQPENNPTVPQPIQGQENSPPVMAFQSRAVVGPKFNSKLQLSNPEALKLTIIFLGVIAITVGYHGHYDSPLRTMLKSKAFEKTCQTDKESNITNIPPCPTGSVEMEMSFISVVTIFLILSAIIFILGTVINFGDIKALLVLLDLGYHFVAGGLVIFVGILMITSVTRIDLFIVEQMNPTSTEGCHPNRNKDLYTCPCFQPTQIYPTTFELYRPLSSCIVEIVAQGQNEQSEPTTTTTCRPSDILCQQGDIKQSNNQPDNVTTNLPIIKSGKQSRLPLGIDLNDLHSSRLAELRNFVKFHYKTAAGIIAALNGVVYIIVGLLALKGLLLGGSNRVQIGVVGGGPRNYNQPSQHPSQVQFQPTA